MEHPQGAGLGVGTTWMSVSMDEGGALIAQLRAIGRSASSHVAAALKLQVLHLREKREAKERLRRLRRLLKTAECEQPGQEEAQQELLGGLCTRLKSLEEQLSALAGGRALNIDQKASVELCRRELAYSVMSRQELCAEVSSRDWGGRRSAPAASAASAAMAASLSQWDSICRDSILQIPLAVDAAVDSALGDGSTPSSSSSEYDSGDYSSSFGSSGSEEEEEEEEEDQRGESAARGDEDEDSDEGGSGSMLMSGGSDADSDADNDADSDEDAEAGQGQHTLAHDPYTFATLVIALHLEDVGCSA